MSTVREKRSGKAPPAIHGARGGWPGLRDASRKLGQAKAAARKRGELDEPEHVPTFEDFEREENRRA